MRRIILGLLASGWACTAWAQTQDEPKQSNVQEVTLADLEGMTVRTANSFTARYRNEKGEANGGFTLSGVYKIEPSGSLHVSLARESWWDTPNGRKTGQWQRSSNATLGVPQKDPDGGGDALYLFEDSTLKGLRALQVGGGTTTITFKKSATGLTCTTTLVMAREVGAGATVARSGSEGRRVQILNSKPTSSTCTVQAGAPGR
jgi:hypothetical protein